MYKTRVYLTDFEKKEVYLKFNKGVSRQFLAIKYNVSIGTVREIIGLHHALELTAKKKIVPIISEQKIFEQKTNCSFRDLIIGNNEGTIGGVGVYKLTNKGII